jgi:predicted P-loop ATPase
MAEKIMISRFDNFADKVDKDFAFDDFLRGIKDGKWQDEVLGVRTIQDKAKRDHAKKQCPMVTISGSFVGRKNDSIRKHSGFIAMDVDRIDEPEPVKAMVANDKYLYAAFTSISGRGLCLVFKVDGSRHLDAYNGLAAYLYETYQIIVDQSGKNLARTRFVSFDPYMVVNPGAQLFKKYLPKPKARKVNHVVFVQSDFDAIISQMYERNINICEGYTEWIATAYALISEFGENGRAYFHTLSSLSSKYNAADADRQYDICLQAHEGAALRDKVSRIASIYYHAKQAGIDIYSARTKEIIRTTVSQTKSGIAPADIANNLQKYNQIPAAEALPVIEQTIQKDVKFESENIIEDIQSMLQSYNLLKNSISRNIEIAGRPIDDTDINSIYIDIKAVIDKATKDLVCAVLFSNRIQQYNPIKQLLNEHIEVDKSYPNLLALLESVKTDTPNAKLWIKKWLVSIIAVANGHDSPLTLVFCGEKHGTGKTYWFRHLLPKQIRGLYAESKMDNGKDDEILMTKKLIIMDDEYGGKSKKEFIKMKNITSKEWVNVREPYGRATVDLRRLAMFCGTSNTLQILNDPTGNRRILPIHITGNMDRISYRECDKVALLHELQDLYRSGFNYSILDDEIALLNANTDMFKESTPEEELIAEKLAPGSSQAGEWLSITQIIQYLIGDTKIASMNNTRVGMILTHLGYESKRKKINGSVVTAYFVTRTNGTSQVAPSEPF